MIKTMHTLSLAAFVVAGALLAGCAKEESYFDRKTFFPEEEKAAPEQSREDVVITVSATVSLEPSTRALTADGVKTFAEGDRIAVLYKNTSNETVRVLSFPLKVANIESPGAKTANFSVSIVNPQEGESEVTYVYPAAMVNADGSLASLAAQDGTLETLQSSFDYASGTGQMTASGTTVTLPASVELANQLAICALIIKDRKGTDDVSDDEDVTGSITSLTINDNKTHVYTISRAAAAGPIYVALNPVSTSLITFDASDGTNTYRKMVQSKTFHENRIYPVTLAMYKFVAPPEGALSGVFTMGINKWVYFSKGNLRATATGDNDPATQETWTWSFADNQYDRVGDAVANTKIDGNGSISESGTVDLFGWSTASTYYGIHNSGDSSTYTGDFRDWGDLPISNGGNTANSGWRTPEPEEYSYLISARTCSTVNATTNAHYTMATIDIGVRKVNGVILFPDSYTGGDDVSGVTWGVINGPGNWGWSPSDPKCTRCDLSGWATLQSAGCVFLPAAGYRNGTSISHINAYSYYWTPTIGGTWARILYLEGDSSVVGKVEDTSATIDSGASVRLVTPAAY